MRQCSNLARIWGMDTPHLLLPRDAYLLDAVERSTASHLADVLDAALAWPSTPRAATHNAPIGYRFLTRAEDFRAFVDVKHPWAVRAFECCYAGTRAAPSQWVHDVEADWVREDMQLGAEARERALQHFIELVQGLDAMLLFQANADVALISSVGTQPVDAGEREAFEAALLSVYRRRHIGTGFHRREFSLLLRALLPDVQRTRLERELAPIVQPIWR